mgnify:CR=1 FL=1
MGGLFKFLLWVAYLGFAYLGSFLITDTLFYSYVYDE